MTIGIIGGGAFATALGACFAFETTAVMQWMRNAESASEINADHCNRRYLGETPLPEALRATTDLADLAGCEAILMVLPAQQTRLWLAENAARLPDVPIIACAKGIDRESAKFQSEVLADRFPRQRIGVLSGPGFAAEIVTGNPTALVIAAHDEALAQSLQELLSTKSLRLYQTTDIQGVELGGALKNIIAIGCGVTIGAGLGQSARAALLTRGFAEMVKLGMALGAKPETLGGLSGLGDLTLTATSELSRNFRMGEALGRGESGDIGAVTEGAYSATMAIELGQAHGLELPVMRAISALVEGKMTLGETINNLLSRPVKTEY